MLFSFSALCMLAFLSCSKESNKLLPPAPIVESLEIVWRRPIVPDPALNYTISMNPVLHGAYVVFGTEYVLDGVVAPVLFMDTATGEVRKYWNDYSNGPDAFDSEGTLKEGRYLLLRKSSSIDCIDLESVQTQWQSNAVSGLPNLYAKDGFIYATADYNNGRSNAIMRTPVDQLAWDTVYAFTKTDRYMPDFIAFGFGTLANGDQVIVWKNRNWGSGYGWITDIFAFNLTADSLMWRNRDLDINSGIIPLKIDEGVVYGLVRNRAFAMELATGSLLWDQNVNQLVGPTLSMEFFNGDLHIGPDHVVIMGQSDELAALRKQDGGLVWKREDNGFGMEDRFTYFEGKLFFPSEGLRIVDAQNGGALISQTLSEEIDKIESRIIVDGQRRVMYFHTGREAFCVRIPRGI